MEESEETPQQRQARIRQQKREAKLKANAQERLDKITSLSGRTPESMNDLTTASAPLPPTSFTSSAIDDDPPISVPTARPRTAASANDSEATRMQEEYMRALLGANNTRPEGQAQDQAPSFPGMEGMDMDDPMMKMLQGMMGGMSGDPNAPAPDMSSMIGDFAKSMGVPSFLTNTFFGKPQPLPTPAQVNAERMWKIIRILFATMAGLYMLYTVDASISDFGLNPPAPATVRNPFLIFVTGELMMYGARTALSSLPPRSGLKAYWNSGKEVLRDGAIMVFILGAYSWWQGYNS